MSGANSKVLHAQDSNQYQQPWKRLLFVVGRKGKHELMAIGGKWEACDGDHPEANPQALVKTAVRTFREASGVDLSSCTKWSVSVLDCVITLVCVLCESVVMHPSGQLQHTPCTAGLGTCAVLCILHFA